MTFQTILANNPNDALEAGLWRLKTTGVITNSRNGRVVRTPGPVATTYLHPRERVIFSPLRDANPFFHLYEALWMLAGRKDAASVGRYAKQMEGFADEDGILWGAYGQRWRHWFGFDQLTEVIAQLRADPLTRRAVLAMWSPVGDLTPIEGGERKGGAASKDLPCNTHVYFDAALGRLDMTVCNRSNDIVWGAYGANVVHMSVLQEFVAGATRIPMGVYHQVSNNFHAYLDRPDVQRLLDTISSIRQDGWAVRYKDDSRYTSRTALIDLFDGVSPNAWPEWLAECRVFVEAYANPEATGAPGLAWMAPFFTYVAGPLMEAHCMHKAGQTAEAAEFVNNTCLAEDWRIAASEWLSRRVSKEFA